ncbi:hypothetical protein [Paenibacillus glycanilyticus]|uniref:hypothetical protein n=1 Tax=Paenibacillus glycanilyticus TaxID=126569 RepID=UPI000FD804FA|nr:hypothetical protein [Paenibacillus glycanilyticus]
MGKRKLKKKKNSITGLKDKMRGKFYHRFQVDNDIPTLVVLFPFLHDYSDFKDECITKYNKLIRRESNIEHYYLDLNMGISININTIEKKYSLLINNEVIINQPLLYDEGDLEDLATTIQYVRGINIHSACISENSLEVEEFVISLFNVNIDSLEIRKKRDEDEKSNFIKLPNSTWYEDGLITPGGILIGTSLDENMNPIDSMISLRNYTEQGHEYNKEVFNDNLKVEGGVIKNLSVIIDETDKENILVKLELFNLDDSRVLFNTTVPIKVSKNYKNFKDTFKKNAYSYFILEKRTQQEQIQENFSNARINNIIFIDEERRNDLVRWIDPMKLDLGGLDGQKKVLINKNSLEVSIYKFTELRLLSDVFVRKIFNELVASKIGLALGLPMVETHFHMEQDTVGIITNLVTPPVYKFSEIKPDLIQNFNSLIEMVAFDIFLCNTDRHIENICFSKQNNKYLPVLIDHTRCLGGYGPDDLEKLDNDVFHYYFNFTGLDFINDRITSMYVFQDIIKRIKSLNISETINFSLEEELRVFVDSCNAYDEGIFEELVVTLKSRQVNIDEIIKKSLGF